MFLFCSHLPYPTFDSYPKKANAIHNLDEAMQGDQPEEPKKRSKKKGKGKKNKNKRDRSSKKGKKESRKKKEETEPLEEGFLEVSSKVPEYLAQESKLVTAASEKPTSPPTEQPEAPTVDQMASVPDMPTHEPDNFEEEHTKPPATVPKANLEEHSVSPPAFPKDESPKMEVEVDHEVPVCFLIPPHRSPDQTLTPSHILTISLSPPNLPLY